VDFAEVGPIGAWDRPLSLQAGLPDGASIRHKKNQPAKSAAIIAEQEAWGTAAPQAVTTTKKYFRSFGTFSPL
jgi:hypothetical protein